MPPPRFDCPVTEALATSCGGYVKCNAMLPNFTYFILPMTNPEATSSAANSEVVPCRT
jgi:hypothetical protein